MATDFAAFQHALIADIREHGAPTMPPMAGRPLMILTTTGAKSGEPREAVVTYTRDGDRYVIAASMGGAPTNPAWYHNLLANPEATAETGGASFRVRASEATGQERDRLWEQHATERPEFREYPHKTSRVIPVLVLERIA
jgi:deazaflavin-dependent oxidoreductase (nitroreductase family)